MSLSQTLLKSPVSQSMLGQQTEEKQRTAKRTITIHILGGIPDEYEKLYQGAKIRMELSANETTAQLKQQLFAVAGIPVASQRLFFAGKFFDDTEQLSNYNLSDGCTISLFCRESPEVTWDISKAPVRNDKIVFLQTILTQLKGMEIDSSNFISLFIDLYLTHFPALSKEHKDGDSTNTMPFDIEILNELAEATKIYLKEAGIPEKLADFIGDDFLKNHSLSYPEMIRKYEDEILLGEHIKTATDKMVCGFKRDFCKKLQQEADYIKYHKKRAVQWLREQFAAPTRSLIDQDKEIECYADQRRRGARLFADNEKKRIGKNDLFFGKKYEHLRLFVVNPEEAFLLIKFVLENYTFEELFKFQLIIKNGHATCFEIEISAGNKLVCRIFDSISDIGGVEELIKRIHEELNGTFIHFISTVSAKKCENLSEEELNTEGYAAQMQGDLSSCIKFAIHFGLQAAKYTVCSDSKKSNTKQDQFWTKKALAHVQEKIDPQGKDIAPWFQCVSWKELPVKFSERSQSLHFLEKHHARFTPRSIDKIPDKILKRTQAIGSEGMECYLKGAIARMECFLAEAGHGHRILRKIWP